MHLKGQEAHFPQVSAYNTGAGVTYLNKHPQ